MPVKIIATEQRVTAFLEGEIDHHTASTLRMEIDDAIQTYKPKVLKLDYGDVTFMDSSGVGLVMGRVRTMSPFGGRIIVSNLSPQTYKVMQLAGLEKIAKISKREDVSDESKNDFRMTIDSRSVNEAFSRSTVAAFAAQLDPTVDEITDIKTAVSEAVTNCIVHAYPDSVGKIYIYAAVFEDNSVKISVRDRGVGIPDVKKAMEPLFTTLGGERAGLGFAVMESFMDKITVRSKEGRGTTVTMLKKISGREER